ELQDARVGTVARQQFDLLQQQVNFLRHQNEQLINQLTRIKRKEVGLPEVPRPPRERPKPMPRELIDYCNKFASENVRRAEMEALERRHRDGESWDSIMADVFGSLAKGRDARQAAEMR